MVAPAMPAQGLLAVAQVGGGGQVTVPFVEPPQPIAAPTVVQTGAPGGKQQAAVKPFALSVQFCKVEPVRLPHAVAVVALAQVGAGGQVLVQEPPAAQSKEQALWPASAARQIDPPDGKQQVAM
jgi:hypothetical protein